MHPAVRTVPGFLSPGECADLMAVCERHGFREQTDHAGRVIRRRAQFEDAGWGRVMWDRLRDRVPPLPACYTSDVRPFPAPPRPVEQYRAAGLNERFRCYEYQPGEMFRPHLDLSHEYPDGRRTFLTVLIFLVGGFEGGGLAFEDGRVDPEPGLLVLFPHELRHAGEPVTAGTKITLRTDVVFAPAGEGAA